MLRPPTRFQQRTIWSAATGVALLVIAALLVFLIWLTGQVLGFLQPVLVPLALAGIIAYLLDPLVRWFQKRGLSRLRSVVMVFGCALAAFLLLLAVMIPQVGNQVAEFRRAQERRAAPELQSDPETGKQGTQKTFDVVGRLDQLRNDHTWLSAPIEHLLEEADAGPAIKPLTDPPDSGAEEKLPLLESTRLWQYWTDYSDDLARSVFGWVKGGTGKVLGALGLFIGFVMVPIYLYYFLKESSGIKEHWHDYVPLRASKFKDELIDVIQEINGYLVSFFRGQVLVAFIDGLLVGIALSIFGLPLGLLIGIMMAILGVIPYIGNIICLIPACTLAYIHFGDQQHQYWLGSNPWIYVAGVIVIFVVVQQINSLVTAPKIVGDSVGLHPMTVIFSMLFWSLLLGGFIGALLAVPLTASVKVLFRRYIWQKRIADTPAEKEPVPEPDADPEPA